MSGSRMKCKWHEINAYGGTGLKKKSLAVGFNDRFLLSFIEDNFLNVALGKLGPIQPGPPDRAVNFNPRPICRQLRVTRHVSLE